MNARAVVDRFTDILRQLGDKRAVTAAVPDMPSHVRTLSSLDAAIRVQRLTNIALLAGLGLIIGWQQVRIHHLMQDLRDQDYLVVPGASDFLRIRANLIPDAAVLEFATYFTERMINVSHRGATERYEAMSQYMSPPLWAAVQRDLSESLPLLSAISGTELFHLSDVTAVRKTTGNKTAFTATIHGRVEKFAGPRRLADSDEVVTVDFRTAPISGDEPWIFEVTAFERRSAQEHAEFVAMRRTMEQ